MHKNAVIVGEFGDLFASCRLRLGDLQCDITLDLQEAVSVEIFVGIGPSILHAPAETASLVKAE